MGSPVSPILRMGMIEPHHSVATCQGILMGALALYVHQRLDERGHPLWQGIDVIFRTSTVVLGVGVANIIMLNPHNRDLSHFMSSSLILFFMQRTALELQYVSYATLGLFQVV